MPERRCSMVISWSTTPDGDPDDDIVCGKPAYRAMGRPAAETPGAHPDAGHWLDGCCEECFVEMRKSGDYTDNELEVMYPLVVINTPEQVRPLASETTERK